MEKIGSNIDSLDKALGLEEITPEEHAYSNKLVEATMGEGIFEDPKPQDLGAAAIEKEKPVRLKSFEELPGYKDHFPKENSPEKVTNPQSLGAAVAEKNGKRIPYPIHSELGRLNEGLRDSTKRMNQIIKDGGPKAGIEHYKKQIDIYEKAIREAEEAKARYLNSIQKSSIEKNEVKTKEASEENVSKTTIDENKISFVKLVEGKDGIHDIVEIPDETQKKERKDGDYIRRVENAPTMEEMSGFNNITLKDLAGVGKESTVKEAQSEIKLWKENNGERSDKTIKGPENLNDEDVNILGNLDYNKVKQTETGEGKEPLTIEQQIAQAKEVAGKIDAEKGEELKTEKREPFKDASEGWYGKAGDLPMHKIEETLNKFDSNTEKKIEEKGTWVMEKAREVGNWYKKQPLKYKVLLSVGLFAAASAPAIMSGAAIGTIASAAFVGSLGQRALGGLATFVATEAWLKNNAEKDGRERSNAEATRHTIEAAVLGMLVGSGYAAEGIKNIADATGITTLVTDAYNYWIPQDAEKIIESARSNIAPTTPDSATGTPDIKLNVSDDLNIPKAEAPHLDIDLPKTPHLNNLDIPQTPTLETAVGVAGKATQEALGRGLTSDFSVELGKNGMPSSLEKVFHMISANHMDLKDVAIFGEADGSKSLNIAANLVKLAEGHNLADVDNIPGISASTFNEAASWDQAKNILTIKNHDAFNEIVNKLSDRADTLWDQGVLKTGASAYINDIKPEAWTEILHADSLDKVGGVETGILGHDDIIPSQIADFDNSEVVKTAEEAQRKIAERLNSLRDELNAKPEPIKGNTFRDAWGGKDIPAKEALQSIDSYNVKRIMDGDINKLFGSKGFFGFGAKDGINSAEWLKVKDLPTTKTGGALREYINNLSIHTGANPQPGETSENFIKRAIASFIRNDELAKGPMITKATVEAIGATEVPITPVKEIPTLTPNEAPSTLTPHPEAPVSKPPVAPTPQEIPELIPREAPITPTPTPSSEIYRTPQGASSEIQELTPKENPISVPVPSQADDGFTRIGY